MPPSDPSSAGPAPAATEVFAAGEVILQDRIRALPPWSTRIDGATHITRVTGHRLRADFTDLRPLVGQPLELRGLRREISHAWLQLEQVEVLAAARLAAPSQRLRISSFQFAGDSDPVDLYRVYMYGDTGMHPVFLPGLDCLPDFDPLSFLRGPGPQPPVTRARSSFLREPRPPDPWLGYR